MTEPIDQLAAALTQFQLTLPEITKGERARVETKTGGSYTYEYADLSDVARAVLPALAAHGLAWICTLNAGQLTARLVHVSGQYVESTWRVPDSDDPKAVGSQLTYGRRYLLITMTGVHPAGEDDDGDAAVARQRPAETGPRPSPLKLVISRGREAGLTDDRIRADLAELGPDQTKLTAEQLRPLYTKYTQLLAERDAHHENAQQAGPPPAQPSEVDVDGDDSGKTAAESEPVGTTEEWPDTPRPPDAPNQGEPIAAAAEAENADEDMFGGADPDGDPVVDDEPEEGPVVTEEGATAEEVRAAANTVDEARARLNDQLAARRAKAAGRG